MKTLILFCILILCGIAYGSELRKHCWKFNKQLVGTCFRFDELCVNNDECETNQICCEHECGTQCRNIDLIEPDEEKKLVPSEKKGCPPIDLSIACIWFHETCKQDSDCKEKNICCANTCGTFCHKPNDEL